MYIFFGIFILICIFICGLFSPAQKTDYPKNPQYEPLCTEKAA